MTSRKDYFPRPRRKLQKISASHLCVAVLSSNAKIGVNRRKIIFKKCCLSSIGPPPDCNSSMALNFREWKVQEALKRGAFFHLLLSSYFCTPQECLFGKHYAIMISCHQKMHFVTFTDKNYFPFISKKFEKKEINKCD